MGALLNGLLGASIAFHLPDGRRVRGKALGWWGFPSVFGTDYSIVKGAPKNRYRHFAGRNGTCESASISSSDARCSFTGSQPVLTALVALSAEGV